MLIVLYRETGHLNKGILEIFLLVQKQSHSCRNFLRLTKLSVRCHQTQIAHVLYVHQVWMYQNLLRVISQREAGEFCLSCGSYSQDLIEFVSVACLFFKKHLLNNLNAGCVPVALNLRYIRSNPVSSFLSRCFF